MQAFWYFYEKQVLVLMFFRRKEDGVWRSDSKKN